MILCISIVRQKDFNGKVPNDNMTQAYICFSIYILSVSFVSWLHAHGSVAIITVGYVLSNHIERHVKTNLVTDALNHTMNRSKYSKLQIENEKSDPT